MAFNKFQSSPDPQAGSYGRPRSYPLKAGMFQSSPDPQAGSYPRHGSNCGCWSDPFQSSPDPQAGSYEFSLGELTDFEKVSILSRPAGRELPGT